MILLTVLVVGAAAFLAPEAGQRMRGAPLPLAAGWGMSMVNALAGHAINRRALRRQGRGFLRWAVGANVLRFLVLFGMVAAFLLLKLPGSEAFLVAVFSGYFAFLTLEVLDLNRIGQTTP